MLYDNPLFFLYLLAMFHIGGKNEKKNMGGITS